ncbi:phospholipase D-like domain-containing protein [Chamaesiphon sp. OTE_75_metabat_556]|uniref:phospholipase D-like domain-containing protein n=1 Tax=Chamaesiphon sp. OTE_75_metabat_556 TaxID=2964692 RepID=UPI00286B1461|nr:phospholipase D-like domain-containing protein [Chamaesiphon sp. OTE_75_metabat_556]
MNIKTSLTGIEYTAIGLSALGTVAAVITQQIAYVAAPLTLSLSLSLIDRQKALSKVTKRLANLEQQFTSEIESVVKQSQAIQSELHAFPPTVSKSDFEKLAQHLSTDRQELKRLSIALHKLEQRGQDLMPFLTEIDLTKDSLKQLSLNFSNFEQQFARRQGTNGIDRATDEIRSNRQYPSQIDRSPRLEDLSMDLLEPSDSIYLSIEQIKSKIQLLEESSKVAEDSIKQVGWRFLELEQSFSDRQEPISIAEIRTSIELVSTDLSTTKTDYILKQIELSLDKDLLQEFMDRTNLKIQSLGDGAIATDLLDRVNDLDASLGDLHDYNLNLTNRIDNYPQHEIVEIINTAISAQNIGTLVQQEVEDRFEIIKQILPKNYGYDLICGRKESRTVFLQALQYSQQRLILVCPWLTEFAVNLDVQDLIKAALGRGVAIEIGWGHLNDANNNRSQLSKERLLASSDWAYSAIPWLYELQVEYPDLLKLKILGTHEKFLVCDRQFAMLGSHNYLTSSTSSSEREVGLRTDSPELIDKLIEIFDHAEA